MPTVPLDNFVTKRPEAIVRDAAGGVSHLSKLAPDPADLIGVPPLNATELKASAIERGIEWKDGYEDRIRRFVASDDRPDRYGDIVRQDWQLDEYRRNPVILFSHESWKPPIGRSLAEHITEIRDKTTGNVHRALVLDVLFAGPDVSEDADKIFRLVEGGFLSTGSVGFKAGQVVDVTDDEERNRLGLGKYGYVLERPILREYSITSLPANIGAELVAAEKSGRISAEDATFVRSLSAPRDPMPEPTKPDADPKPENTDKSDGGTPITRSDLAEFRKELLADVATTVKAALPQKAKSDGDGNDGADETPGDKMQRRLQETDVELKKTKVELFIEKSTNALRAKGCPLTVEQIREKLLEPDTDEGRRLMVELLESKKTLPTDDLGSEEDDAARAKSDNQIRTKAIEKAKAEYAEMVDVWKAAGIDPPFDEDGYVRSALGVDGVPA